MKGKLKGGLIVSLVMALLLALTLPVGAALKLVYTNGRVNDIEGDKIIVSGRAYVLDPHVRVLVHTKQNNAYYQTFGNRQDVHAGASVYIQTIGNKVVEIIVERWKQ